MNPDDLAVKMNVLNLRKCFGGKLFKLVRRY